MLKFTESRFDAKCAHSEIGNLSRYVFFKSNLILGNIKHENEYKTFENESNTKSYRVQEKLIEYKIFKLKYGHLKLLFKAL